MQRCLRIIWLAVFVSWATAGMAQQAGEETTVTPSSRTAYRVRTYICEGDTLPYISLPAVYIYRPLQFKNKRQARRYDKLVRDVKKVLPIANEVQRAIIETYEYLMTLPDDKARQRHLKAVEKSIKQQYTPRMKKLTFAQGKLLIKLVDRQTHSTGYELVKAFLGPFRAGFYQAFAALFGASLKKEYDPEGEDALTERVVRMVENGQL